MPGIISSLRLMDVGPVFVRDSVASEFIIDKELHLNARRRMRLVNGPSGDQFPVRRVQDSTQIRISGGKIKSHRDCRYQQGFRY
jgi:hypothetical protein